MKKMTRLINSDFDEDLKPVVTGSVYIQIEEKDANQAGIAECVKQITNCGESFAICDPVGWNNRPRRNKRYIVQYV